MKSEYEALLALTRLGLGHSNIKPPQEIEWEVVQRLANDHGLSAVVLDGIEKMPELNRPSKIVLLNWIGEILQSYEQRYSAYEKAISTLAAVHNDNGFKMMLLKGYSCALDWPNPAHRPCGDIDIWQFGNQKEIDQLLAIEKGVKIDTSQHIHTVFEWQGFMVENHFDFINTHAHKSSKELEKLFKEMGMDDSHAMEINGEKVYVPSPNMNALFLLRHAMAHFAAQGINLRQLLDWAFFAQKHSEEIDWKWLEDELKHYGMLPLYSIFNAICVEDLGFEARIFHGVQFDSTLKERVLNEILSPEFSEKMPKNIITRMLYKFRRWKGNAWKYELCFKESRVEAFWNGVWNHILKPSTI
jgi:hypothetical protein